jgi:hypothetical protein
VCMKARNFFVRSGIHSVCTISVRLGAGRAECQNHVLFVDLYENESITNCKGRTQFEASCYSFRAL